MYLIFFMPVAVGLSGRIQPVLRPVLTKTCNIVKVFNPPVGLVSCSLRAPLTLDSAGKIPVVHR